MIVLVSRFGMGCYGSRSQGMGKTKRWIQEKDVLWNSYIIVIA
jgi:hypothetical protein